ncbi:Phage Tail Protein X [Geodermatophilus obscurus]|uniref:Phage Tail Protein X n=1 Tax=Geodermatophilus obscurus TaxID=1861 RepID=A0A1M7S3E8_9ACTN|nr:tail protein X [Geodermatophilus obscurus]SHN53018.1 Phage Tail Protein X [Geodermatophilus obscurus]
MVFSPDSRYADVGTAELQIRLPDGTTRTVVHARRRLLPPPDAGATLAVHRAAAGDRLDLLAARYLGDPEGFWRICDANPVLRPRDLLAERGAAVRIPLPGMPG